MLHVSQTSLRFHKLAAGPKLSQLATALIAGLALAGLASQASASRAIAQASPSACPAAALTRLTRHRVTSGETLSSIAQRYSLLPGTLMGFNPAIQGGAVSSGQELLIPPYNGIRVSVSSGQTWQDVAQTYNSRADVLFEVNGCVSTVPPAVFVPGVNWYPEVRTVAATPAASQSPLQGYPLPQRSQVIINYGWQPDPTRDELVFNTGVALASPARTPVLAVGPGTVAFAGSDSVYGNLVVINHPQGLQTRYANLDALEVRAGQTVNRGDRLGPVAIQSGESFLFFEVRLNSAMGWVAQDPQDFVPAMVLR
ncbi:MAG: M23 family metallopeptidase [Nodosilinea sp.]